MYFDNLLQDIFLCTLHTSYFKNFGITSHIATKKKSLKNLDLLNRWIDSTDKIKIDGMLD